MASQLFRQEVIEAGRDRLVGAVVAATPPRSRTYTLLATAAAGVLLALLLFGSYATRQQVRGIIAHDRGVARVYPPAAAEVRAIHVQVGQAVRAGTPLATVALSPGRGDGSEGMESQVAEIGAQDSELARQQSLARTLGWSERRALEQQRASLAAAVASLERQRGIAAQQVSLAESESRRAARLAADGAGTQRQVEESQAQLLARRTERESIDERLISQREQLRSVSAQIEQRRLDSERNLSEITGRRAALAERRSALVRQDRLVLTAPIDGIIGEIAVETGQRARPDASLVTVVPRGSRLEVWLYAPSRAVGFVRPGQEVRLLLDAFRYQTYGSATGRVTAVSQVATDPANVEPGLGIQEPVFRIRATIDTGAMRLPAGTQALRQGMTVSANLVLERRRLWQVFFAPMLSTLRG